MLWNICWRLSRHRAEYVVRGPELELGNGPSRRGKCEMVKNEEGRVEELVSELDLDTGTDTK
jgi:hypothetical protein